MAAAAQTRAWTGPSRRRVPRFHLQAPLDVTVLRSGVPDTVPGRSVNLCERGIAAVLAGELAAGEVVNVDIRLPRSADPLRARAMVRYQDKLRCGLEFLGLTAGQRATIREWAKDSRAETEIVMSSTPAVDAASAITEKSAAEPRREAVIGGSSSGGGPPGKPSKKRSTAWTILLVLAAITVAAFWWRWNRSWRELESGLKAQELTTAEKPQAQVPAEVMEKLLQHRVEPTYPPEARQQNLQAVIALDIVVGRDGTVVAMHPLNGPDVLAHAAMDALRWWKFEPYRLNGDPAIVETTVAVEFKK
jgi:outer membrane biosynthesis protein TonB